jgi:hypothetical protein
MREEGTWFIKNSLQSAAPMREPTLSVRVTHPCTDGSALPRQAKANLGAYLSTNPDVWVTSVEPLSAPTIGRAGLNGPRPAVGEALIRKLVDMRLEPCA